MISKVFVSLLWLAACLWRVSPFTISLSHGHVGRRIFTQICMGKTATSQTRLDERWFPERKVYDDDIYAANDEDTEAMEDQSLNLLANLINRWLENGSIAPPNSNNRAYQMAKGRFLDLTCTERGERVLESLFNDKKAAEQEDDQIVLGAIVALQSLCIMGTQVGVKGTPEQLQRMVAHLETSEGDPHDVNVWDSRNSVRRLKYQIDQTAGTQLLAIMNRKRSALGAFDLLVQIGAWERHENLALLRSGFPIRFTPEEEAAAKKAKLNTHDPDSLLGLRKDFRREKIYTIDSASTSEIDDGLSLEVIMNEDGTTRQRFWVHIADADRWAPRDSEVFKVATRRATSLYLPSGTIPMFPSILSSGVMALTAYSDACALSIGVDLLPDGSIDASTIELTPSLIRVSYRLSYDEVDEMLEEGVGYSEEWQLGAMLVAANKRRRYRMSNGSTEAMVPKPIPQSTVKIHPDKDSPDGVAISIDVEVSHNAGKNQTADAEIEEDTLATGSAHVAPVSPAFTLVTEMMIMAGEAVGKWKTAIEKKDIVESVNGNSSMLRNTLKLPFRCQPKPDYQSRARERKFWDDLLESNAGDGYCHAWYARRFFQPVQVSEASSPHHGLGLESYVQWTSPIRRLGDLQTHSAIKRYLRRKRINDLIQEGKPLPSEITPSDIGCPVPVPSNIDDGRMVEYKFDSSCIDDDIDFRVGQGLVGAARQLQRRSQQYWLFEHISRRMDEDPSHDIYEALVLGCVDPERYQYAIYLPELGLEHRYLSHKGLLQPGARLRLRVQTCNPISGLMYLTIAG